MSSNGDMAQLGPGAQAVRLSFRFIAVLTAVAALAWATSNVRRVPADSRAVVTRFGAFVRTQDAGLVLAWPCPFEDVMLVPGKASVLALPIRSLERDPRALAADSASANDRPPDARIGAANSPGNEISPSPYEQDENPSPGGGGSLPDALAGSGYLLTGDNGVAQLHVTLYYRIVDPYAYTLEKDRLDAALQRIVATAAVQVVASRDLDAILVARPETQDSDQKMAIARERLREELAQAVGRHLQALDARQAGLGVEVSRIDLQAAFPAAAAGAFNAVLTSLQQAERDIAEARTVAERRRQEGRQSADRIVEQAHASSTERVAAARVSTAIIEQYERSLQGEGDPGLTERAYRDRIQRILAKAARVTTLDPHDASHLILPGNVK